MAPYAEVLFEIHNLLVAGHEANKEFLVEDEPANYDHDEFAGLTIPDSSQCSRDPTPAPLTVFPPCLRFTTLNMPKYPHKGFVCGSDSDCDVVLAFDVNNAVRSSQFAIKMQREPGLFIVENLSLNYHTLMRHEADGYVGVKSQRAFGRPAGDRMDVLLGKHNIEIRTPNHEKHLQEFCTEWMRFYGVVNSMISPENVLGNLALATGPATRNSVNYYPSGEIGRGNGTVVYKVVHRVTAEVLAVKCCKSRKHGQREAHLLQALEHKHIVAYYDFNDKTLELFLKYIGGGTLRDEDARQRFNVLELKTFLKQSLKAFSYLEYKGITHRDFKLDNVMLQTREPLHIRLIDFDVGSDKAIMETYTGAEAYMAPEIVNFDDSNRRYDSKADIWSLGVAGADLLFGLPPKEVGVPYSTTLLVHIHTTNEEGKYYEVVSFITHLLQPCPQLRPTAKQALAHDSEYKYLHIRDKDDETTLPPPSPNFNKSLVDTLRPPEPYVTVRAYSKRKPFGSSQPGSKRSRHIQPDIYSATKVTTAVDGRNDNSGSGDLDAVTCDSDDPEDDDSEADEVQDDAPGPVGATSCISPDKENRDYLILSYDNGRRVYFTADGYINVTQIASWAGITKRRLSRCVARGEEKRCIRQGSQQGTYFRVSYARKLFWRFMDRCDPINKIAEYLDELRKTDHGSASDLLHGIANKRRVCFNTKTYEWSLSHILDASNLDSVDRSQLVLKISEAVQLREAASSNGTSTHWISFLNGVRIIHYVRLHDQLRDVIMQISGFMPSDDQFITFDEKSIHFTLDGNINVTNIANWAEISRDKLYYFLSSKKIEKQVVRGNRPNHGTFINMNDAKNFCQTYGISLDPIGRIEECLLDKLVQALR